MRLALWSPRPGDGWVGTLAPLLSREATLEVVDAEPLRAPVGDLDIYHLSDDPVHAFVHRALLRRPGLVVLEEWSLHRLVHAETVGRGDPDAYRREARRAHGEAGLFVARQVLRGLGGRLPTLLPLNESSLEACLGLVATTEVVRARAAARLPDRPVLHLPLPFVGTPALPDRPSARAALALPPGHLIVAVVRPTGSPEPEGRLVPSLADLTARAPRAALTWTTEADPRLPSHVAAADVVVALEDPVRSSLGKAIPLAVAAGRPTLVTAGSGAAREIPEGVVARVSPGRTEATELVALVERLLADESLRLRMGRLASAFAAERSDPHRSARALLDLGRSLAGRTLAAAARRLARGVPAENLGRRALEDVRAAARQLGLNELPPGTERLLGRLFPEGVH